MPNGSWIEELKGKGILLPDFGSDKTDIDILIGMDLLGTFLTGETEKLRNSMIAMQTIFGWTLGGKNDQSGSSNSIAAISISMLVNQEKSVADMWQLETLGIYDSAGVETRHEDDEQVKRKLQKEMTRDKNGLHCVKLPFVSTEVPLPSNLIVAEKRLVKATEKMRKKNVYWQYDEVFKNWQSEGIIEEIDKKEDEGYYLPRRPVLKPESLTTPVRPVLQIGQSSIPESMFGDWTKSKST